MYCSVILQKKLAGEARFSSVYFQKAKTGGWSVRAVIIWFYMSRHIVAWKKCFCMQIKDALCYIKVAWMQVSQNRMVYSIKNRLQFGVILKLVSWCKDYLQFPKKQAWIPLNNLNCSLWWDGNIYQNAHTYAYQPSSTKHAVFTQRAYICISNGFFLDELLAETEGEGASGQSIVKLKVSGWGFVYPTNQFGCKLDLKSCPRPPWASSLST